MSTIAIVDDEKILVNSLRIELASKGHEVHVFYEAAPFLEYITTNQPDIVFLDLKLPDAYGLDVLNRINESDSLIHTIIITAHGNMESAIQALKAGAYDYLNKPFELEEIGLLIDKIINGAKLLNEVEHRRSRSYKSDRIENFIGESQAIKNLLKQVNVVAEIGQTTVMIRGESGTGKELLAKALHNLGPFSSKQFIDINCASLPDNLLESELFGYEKGAFTDAKSRKTGLVEMADGGTLFLDEIGELPLHIQAKLLRFLETRSFRRIGGAKEIKIEAMIVTATNRNLEKAVEDGVFREDLYYRLNVVPLRIPPLRERAEDILLIADHYLAHFALKFGKPGCRLAEKAKQALLSYDWPGNVRELRNLVEMVVIMGKGPDIGCSLFPAKIKDREAGSFEADNGLENDDAPLPEKMRRFERMLVQEALTKSNGVKAEAAKLLGISRYALIRRIKSLFNQE